MFLLLSSIYFNPARGQENVLPNCLVNADWTLSELKKCGKKGFSDAQALVGIRYLLGLWGVDKNLSEAKYWLLDAARQKNRLSQFWIGYMHQHGLGYPVNDTEAVKWYRLAAEQGYSTAQGKLGAMYAAGQGVSKNPIESFKWYKLAAENGHARSQLILGKLYVMGEGVPEDDVLAFMWFNLSAAQGDELAIKNKEVMRNMMSQEQIAEAQKLSRDWIDKHP